jgi:hypothetical protein
LNRKTDDLPMIKELGLRFRSLRKRARLTRSDLRRKFPAHALDGLDRQLRRAGAQRVRDGPLQRESVQALVSAAGGGVGSVVGVSEVSGCAGSGA